MTAVKFTFDDDFDNDSGTSVRKEKLEELRASAYEEGLYAGREEVRHSIEQSCENLLQNILVAAQNLQARQDEQISLMNKEAAKLAYSIIEKLAPALVSQTPLAEIELLVNQCLKNSPLEPRLVIRADDAVMTSLEERVDDLIQASGFSGKIILVSQPMGHISDCIVEWANGGAERDFTNLMNTIESTVRLFIEAPESPSERADERIDPETGTISEHVTRMPDG